MIRYIFKSKISLFLNILLGIVLCLSIVFLYFIYSMISEAATASDSSALPSIILYVVISISVLALSEILSVFTMRKCMFETMNCLRNDLANSLMHLNYSEFHKLNSSDYTSMLVNDTETLEYSYYEPIMGIIYRITELLITMTAIALIGFRYLFLVLLLTIPSIIQPYIMKNRLARRGLEVSTQAAALTGITNEHINGYSSIKLNNRTNEFLRAYSQASASHARACRRQNDTAVINLLLMLVCVYALKVGSELFFVSSAVNSLISAASITTLFALANNVGNPILSILALIEPISSTKEIRDRFENCLNAAADEAPVHAEPVSFDREIRICNLSFAYTPENPVIDGLNVCFKKGGKYAITGESGCGKSTLLKLIMRHCESGSGEIFIDNTNLHDIPEPAFKPLISYISQENHIFNDSIKANILMGSEYDEEHFLDVIKVAELESIIEIAGGTEKPLSSETLKLSQGERQRIAIARALYRNSPIILMDEMSSSLDNITASLIEEKLLKASDKTIISIVHRFNAGDSLYDRVFEMKNGRLISVK